MFHLKLFGSVLTWCYACLLQDEMDPETAILGRVSPRKQVLPMFDQGTTILAGSAGNREMIKVSSQGR